MEPSDVYRIVLLADGVVGKTAIVIQYTKSHFVREWDPNIEDTHSKDVVVDGKKCTLEILDTAGPEEYAPMRSQWIQWGSGFFVIFSYGNRQTLLDAEKTLNEVKGLRPDHPPIILLGNKCDLPLAEREVTDEEINQFATRHGVTFMPCSAKDRTNIEECFAEVVRRLRAAGAPSQPESTEEDRNKAKKCILQ